METCQLAHKKRRSSSSAVSYLKIWYCSGNPALSNRLFDLMTDYVDRMVRTQNFDVQNRMEICTTIATLG